MDYRYKKHQLFRQKLDVPRYIRRDIYNGKLSIKDYFEYKLDDKIPTTCIIHSDRQFIDQFGIEKLKDSDWKLIGDFNYGDIEISQLIKNWDLFHDKDLSHCLSHDSNNTNHITENDLKSFMNDYRDIATLLTYCYNKPFNLNHLLDTVISEVSNLSSTEERNLYMQTITDNILESTLTRDDSDELKLSNEQFKSLFKYSSIKEYLKKDGLNEYRIDSILKELQALNLTTDFLFSLPIPFTLLKEPDVLRFVGTYGLKNVVDFDLENEEFFTKNNCEMLRMTSYIAIMKDREIDILNKPNKNDSLRTNDEFYEVMKRIIMDYHVDGDYASNILNYKEMKGAFKDRHPELFLEDDAPEELKQLFYDKKITPACLLEHPDYVKYLNGKICLFVFLNE